MKILCALLLFLSGGEEVRYFPTIVYGHILIGAGMSRYETAFTIVARAKTRVSLNLFTDTGQPMNATFVDTQGRSVNTGNSVECFLMPDRPVQIRLMLTPDEAGDDVSVKTGWATFHSTEELDVSAIVRISDPDGKLLSRHVLAPQQPPAS